MGRDVASSRLRAHSLTRTSLLCFMHICPKKRRRRRRRRRNKQTNRKPASILCMICVHILSIIKPLLQVWCTWMDNSATFYQAAKTNSVRNASYNWTLVDVINNFWSSHLPAPLRTPIFQSAIRLILDFHTQVPVLIFQREAESFFWKHNHLIKF